MTSTTESNQESLLPTVQLNNSRNRSSHTPARPFRASSRTRTSSANSKKRMMLRRKTGDNPSSSPSSSPLSPRRTGCDMLRVLFFFVFLVSALCIVAFGVMVQQHGLSNGEMDDATTTRGGIFTAIQNAQILHRLKRLSSVFSTTDTTVQDQEMRDRAQRQLGELADFDCVGWRQTMNCTPSGLREYKNDQNCSTVIKSGVSGYCEIKHRTTGQVQRVMQMHCDSLRPNLHFTCAMFPTMLGYGLLSTYYIHDANVTYTDTRKDLMITNSVQSPVPLSDDGVKAQSVGVLDLSFEKGIAMVIYEKLLPSAYASIRGLRSMGCTLPIELWYLASETKLDHPLLRVLVSDFGVYMREIRDPRATRFYTKLHAVFYSAFDNVLLLDADNFAARDPTYLFETPEYVETGAMFWPDFWRPGNTIFNVHERSFLWEVFDIQYKNMFEQESGQVLINRRQHMDAMNVMMYYGFHTPRLHEELRLVWGDKDLFRLAWMKTKRPFHMIERPPGSAGTKHPDHNLFCGMTMVQHDPEGRVVFLHRNTEKISAENNRTIWTHIQQFKRKQNVEDYYVRGANGGKVFPQFKRCFGKDVHYEKHFTLRPMEVFPFANIETSLLQYIMEAQEILTVVASKNTEGQGTKGVLASAPAKIVVATQGPSTIEPEKETVAEKQLANTQEEEHPVVATDRV